MLVCSFACFRMSLWNELACILTSRYKKIMFSKRFKHKHSHFITRSTKASTRAIEWQNQTCKMITRKQQDFLVCWQEVLIQAISFHNKRFKSKKIAKSGVNAQNAQKEQARISCMLRRGSNTRNLVSWEVSKQTNMQASGKIRGVSEKNHHKEQVRFSYMLIKGSNASNLVS